MNIAATETPRSRQKELGQFLPATSVADLMASMFGPRLGANRRALIEADFVDRMVALTGQLFSSTHIPVCLGFLAKDKNTDAKRGFLNRRLLTDPAHRVS